MKIAVRKSKGKKIKIERKLENIKKDEKENLRV